MESTEGGATGGGGIVIDGLKGPFAVIVGAFEERAGPFSDEAFCSALNGFFWFFRFGVEEDDFAQTGRDQTIFIDGQAGDCLEKASLDVICWQGAVGLGFEEEADGFEKVGFWVDDGGEVFWLGTGEKGDDFGEEFEFVGGGAGRGGGSALDIGFSGFGHADAEGGDLFVEGGGKVLLMGFSFMGWGMGGEAG